MNARARAIAPYAALVGIAIAATLPILRAAGMPYNVDISGFFPLSVEAYEGRFWPLWNERGGMSTLQFLPALAFELPMLIIGHIFQFDMPTHVKLRVVLGFAISGCSMFALARHYVLRRRPAAPAVLAIGAPLAAALLYMFNPWAVHRVFHYFLWLGYALTPLVVLAFERLAASPSWQRGLVFGGVVALATTDPHNPATFAIVLVPLALLRIRNVRQIRALALSVGAFALLAAYWILPYAWNAIHNPGFGPTYVMSDQMLDVLSRHASLPEVLRLLHNYNPRGDLWPTGGWYSIWLFASVMVPVLAFASVALDRSRVAITYALLAGATIFLGMGNQGPGGVYNWLLFSAPWGEGLSWLFRDPYRWGGIQALAYGVMIALSLAALPRVRLPAASPAAAGMLVAMLFCAPALANYTTGAYAPIVVPSEFDEANAFLETTPAEAGVVWMPRTLGAATWSGDKTLAYFDATSSSRAALGPFRPQTSEYFDFLKDATTDGASVGALIARAGASTIVYHNDVNALSGARVIHQLESLGFTEVARVGDSPTLAVDQSSQSAPHTPAARYSIFGNRTLTQTFTPTLATPAVLALRTLVHGEPGPVRIQILNETGALVFSRNTSKSSVTPELEFRLDNVKFVPGTNYTLELSAPTATDANNSYNFSYYKVDTYPRGNMTTLAGDLHFEIVSRTRGFAVVLASPENASRVRATHAPIATAEGLNLLRSLATLPDESPLRSAPVLFVNADEAAMTTFGDWPEAFRWFGGFSDEDLSRVVPFIDAKYFSSPFSATTNADAKEGFARGTQDFEYYSWGWTRSLAALKQESWDFDGNNGLVYSSSPANLTINFSANIGPSVVLARVHESPQGGPLAFFANDTVVGRVNTKNAEPGMKWIQIGVAPEGATQLRIENEGAFQGIDSLVVAPQAALNAAFERSGRAFENARVTLINQAETIVPLNAKTVFVEGVGRVADVSKPVNFTIQVGVKSDYTLWLRGSAALNVTLDGEPVGSVTGEQGWLPLHVGVVRAGSHQIGFEGKALIDSLALSNDPEFASQGDAPIIVATRVSATEYRVDANGSRFLALAQPYDAGWVARVVATGERIPSVPVDGVANGFLLPPDTGEVVLEFVPQSYAHLGVFISLASLEIGLGLLGAAALRRRAREESPWEMIA